MGEHVQTMENVFKCLQDANLTLIPYKSQFGQREIEFIRQVISKGKIQPNKDNINKIPRQSVHRLKRSSKFPWTHRLLPEFHPKLFSNCILND